MAKIKKISELEQLSSLSSSSNVIIEENGQAKRFAASSLEGKVKTVNGIEPDENGNVQIKIAVEGTPPIAPESVQSDWNQNDPAQPDYIKNRTHWEENNQTVIEWDGSTEGKDTIPIDTYGPFILCKVSELTPTKEELISGKYRIAEGSTEFDATPLTESDFYEGDGCLIAGNRLVVVSKTTAIAENGAVWEFPSTGLYAKNRPGLNRFVSVTYDSVTVHPIDEKFIPDTIARVKDIPGDTVLYTPQTLTDEQKAQVRENIGAMASFDPDCHAEYFQITEEGVVSLKPEYRGSCSNTSCPDGISDMGSGVIGSKNAELPSNLVIPEVVNEIAVMHLASGMFYANKAVESVTCPYFITEIPERCFQEAFNLQNVYNTDGVLTIAKCAFQLTQLKKAKFPNLTSLGIGAFNVCPFLTYADIGNNITNLPMMAFGSCGNLSRIKGGVNITSVDQSALLKTSRLNNVEFLANLSAIGDGAFILSRLSYDWGSLDDCTFGTYATALQVHPTDVWSSCHFTPCENRLPTKLSQKNLLWVNRQIGTSGNYYGKNGCSFFSFMHAYCGLHNLPLNSVVEFEGILSELSPNYLNRFTGTLSHLSTYANELGVTFEGYTALDQTSVQAIYDALALGKYVLMVSPSQYTSMWGHCVLVYGVKENGELLIIDSNGDYFQVGVDELCCTYSMPIQNVCSPQYSSTYNIIGIVSL